MKMHLFIQSELFFNFTVNSVFRNGLIAEKMNRLNDGFEILQNRPTMANEEYFNEHWLCLTCGEFNGRNSKV